MFLLGDVALLGRPEPSLVPVGASFIYFMLNYIRTRIFIYLFIVSLRMARTLNSVVAGLDHCHSALTSFCFQFEAAALSRLSVYLRTDAFNPWQSGART